MDALSAFMQAQWDMNYFQFCEFVGLDHRTAAANEEWHRFVKVAENLRAMNPSVLARLAEYRMGMVKV